MKRVRLNSLVMTGLAWMLSIASPVLAVNPNPPIYAPGSVIPFQGMATGAIFRDLFDVDGELRGGVFERPGVDVFGLNSPELAFEDTYFRSLSSFRFDGVLYGALDTAEIVRGAEFLVGYLVYSNGLTGDPVNPPVSSEIYMQTYSPGVANATRTLTDRVIGVLTPNTSDPVASADIIFFQDRPDLGSLRVFEGQTGRIEVFARFGSLDLARFGRVVSNPGSGFFFPTTDATPPGFVPADTGDGSLPPPAPTAQPDGVVVDVKPGDGSNSINPRSNGATSVAILTTKTEDGELLDFDAQDVDPSTAVFGPEAAHADHAGRLEDVDGDGDADLVLHFRTQATGIRCGDASGIVTAETVDGKVVQGIDTITTVGCR